MSGTSVNGIQGYQSGTYTVRAYSDGACGDQIAWADFMILSAALTATVNADRSVDLNLSNGPSDWWFRIGWGSCAAVTGTTVSGISGYGTGTYSVAAYSGSGCTGLIGAANFIIPDPPTPTASLATTVNPGPSVDLTLTNGPNNWWFRINWWGSCTAVSGTSVNNIQGYKAGTHPVAAYSDGACQTEIASSSFTIPALALTVAVDSSDWSVDLTLSGGPSNWWFRIGWWGNCAAASGTGVSNIRGYQSGSHLVAVYPAAGCEMGSHIAAESFTIPSASLATTVDDDRSVDLTLSGGPSQWWFRINSWGGCTSTSGATVSNIQGYQDGTHSVRAYADSGCKYHVASSSFTLRTPALTASDITANSATLTLEDHTGDWWLQQTAPSTGTCTVGESDFSHALSSLTPGTTYTYKAYHTTGCASADEIASETFSTLATLTASNIAATSATLTIAGHTGDWYYQTEAAPDGSCSGPVSGATEDLTGLTPGASYTYSAYSDSGCATLVATASAFTTPASLTASAIAATTATLTLEGRTGNWWLERTAPSGGTCTAGEADFSHALSSLTAGSWYTYRAYSDSSCTTATELASETFSTAVTVGNLTESVNGTGNVGRQFSYSLDTVAQGFTTGSNAGGYTFTSVTVAFHQTFGSPGDIVVTLREEDSANSLNPASSVHATLTGANPTSNTNATFRCVADSTNSCDLDADTTYFVRLNAPNATASNRYTVSVTDTDNETATPSGNGWSIESDGRSGGVYISNTSWIALTDVLKLKVTALLKPSLEASGIADTVATLTLSGHAGNWWLKRTSSPAGACTAGESDFSHALSSLTAGTTYTYQAYSDSACSTLIAASTFTTLTPSLTAGNVTGTTATLTLANGPGNWWLKETAPSTGTCTPKTTTTEDLGSLTTGTSYTYKAYDATGCASADEIASETFTTLAPPATLSAPKLTTGNALLDATWTAPSSDGGSALTDYDLQYSSDGGGTWNRALISPATYAPGSIGNNKYSNGPTGKALDLGTVSLTGLTVTKVTTGGISNVYKISQATGAFRLRLAVVNGKPGQTLTYRARYASTAPTTSNMLSHGTLLWNASANYGGTATGDAWTLALPANTHFWITTTATSNNTDGISDVVTPTIQVDTVTVPATLAARLGGLTNGTTYAVQVRAVNAVGLGPWSPSGTLKAGLPARATAPTLVSGNTQLAAMWAAVSGNGSAITDYDLRYSSDGGSTWTPVEMNAAANTARSYNITGLTNGTSYVVQVRATNIHGDGLWSPSSASVEVGAPDAPTAPSLTPAAGQMTVTWTAPADSGSAITDYDLQYSADGGSTWTFVENGTSTSLTATITSLTDNTAYQVQVRATNARGDSGWSPATTLSTLSVGEIADTSAKLWIARGSHTGDWYLKQTAPTTGTCSTAISKTDHVLSSLTRNTAHTFQAYSDSGCTTVIALITFTTLPSSLTASSVSYTTATLTLTPHSHTGNWYLKQASPTVGTCSTAISGTTHNLSSLTDGVRYRFDAYSDAACTTQIARGGTFDTTLYAPTGLTHSTVSGFPATTTSASWSRNSSTATGAVGYELQRTNDNVVWHNWASKGATTDTSLSHSATTVGTPDIRVRASRTTGGITIYSVWVQ